MKKFNIFEVYGQVHNEKIETPKVEVQSYSPISLGRKTPMIVDGKFSLTESLKKQELVSEEFSGNEAGTIASLTGLRPTAIVSFIKAHNLDVKKLLNYVKKDKSARMDLMTAISGKDGNKYQKTIISKFGLKENVDEAKDPKEAIYQALVKGGNNPTEARKMVDKNYDYVQRVYGDASPKKKAEVIRSIHEGKLTENLMGMKKEPIDNYGSVERYEYVIKGKKARVTIDIMKHKEQGMPGSNFVSIRSSMGEYLADTPMNFKKIADLEKFVKKVHPNLVKIADGEMKSNGVAFTD